MKRSSKMAAMFCAVSFSLMACIKNPVEKIPETEAIQTEMVMTNTDSVPASTENSQTNTGSATAATESVKQEKTSEESIEESDGSSVSELVTYDKNSVFEEGFILLSQSEIETINQKTIKNEKSHMREIRQMQDLSAEQLKVDIEAYQLPNTTYYNGKKVTEEQKQALLSSRNLEEIPEKITLQYGIVTDNVAVRAMPTDATMKNGTDSRDFDYLQESMLLLGEGVVVAHTSSDEEYYFVYSYNYCGWVKADAVGLCSYQEMCNYLDAEDFVIITENQTINKDYIRMGTKIPYSSYEDEKFTLKWPVNENGKLKMKSVVLEADDFCYDGYIPYNTSNVITLYNRLLGLPYGWGDTDENMDCSSTVNSVYRCFGFALPRNTSAMSAIGAKVMDVSDRDSEQKIELLEQCMSGTILLMPGHVMTYMGMTNEEPYIIHNVTQYYQEGELVEAYECSLTPLSIKNSAGESFLSKLTYIVQIP